MSFPFIFSFKTSYVIVHKHISLTASNACRGSHMRWPLTLWSELIKLREGSIANTKRLRKWTWSVRLDHSVSQISACTFTTAAAASVIPWPTFQRHRSRLYISKPCYLSKPRYPVLQGDFGKSSTATCSSFDPRLDLIEASVEWVLWNMPGGSWCLHERRLHFNKHMFMSLFVMKGLFGYLLDWLVV